MAPVDVDKLRHHIDHIRGNLRRLGEIGVRGRSAFIADDITSTAAIRYLQTAVEAVLDIGNHVISREGLGIPHTYAETIELLVDNDILPAAHRDDLVQMVRFRNRAVHLYDEIDAAEVFTIIDTRLSDFEIVIAALTQRYLQQPSEAE